MPISQLQNELRNEIHLQNFTRCFAAVKPPASTCVPLRKLKLHFRSCKPRCEITSKLRIKLQIISKLRNHLKVVKSQIQLAKWTIQTCKIHLCKLRYLPSTKLDFFLKIFCVKFLFSPCNQSKIILGYFLENIFSIYIFEPM